MGTVLDTQINALLSRWESAEPDRKPSAEELCADCPQLLPRLRDCLRQLSAVDKHLAPAKREHFIPQLPGYELLESIGRGGQGVVWSAIQLKTKRTVAIKTIATGQFASSQQRQRFAREVELASRLNHPHIARVYDAIEHAGQLFCVMELVDGIPVDEFVASRRLAEPAVLELMRQICLAVAHAHAQGVVHRDLKPTNILIDAAGAPRLLDFGLARDLSGQAEAQLTLAELPGTPAYMSPEQARGERDAVSFRSDIYSLGVILFKLLLGTFPHNTSGSSREVMHRIATTPAASARQVNRRVRKGIERVLQTALNADPSRRYPTAQSLAEELQRLIDGRPSIGAPIALTRRLIEAARARRRVAWAAAVAVVVIALGIAGFLRRSSDLVVTSAELSDQPDALHAAAFFKMRAGDVAGAEKFYRLSLAAVLKSGRDDSVDAMNDRAALFEILLKQGRTDEAKPFIDDCERLIPTIMQMRNADDAVWLSGYADALITCGHEQLAVKHLEDALPIVDEKFPGDDPARNRVLRSLQEARKVAADSTLARPSVK